MFRPGIQQESFKIMDTQRERGDRIWSQMIEHENYSDLNLLEPVALFERLRDDAGANRAVYHMAGWFDRPRPTGRDIRGECDFAAEKLAFVLARYRERLEPDTLAAILRFFTQFNFQSIYDSENHHLLFHSSRFIVASRFPELEFRNFEGRTGAGIAAEDLVWLKKFLRFRARRGWGEFDSTCYIIPDWECMCLLFDYSGDAELRRLCENMMNLLLADFMQESFEGCHGGAHGRIYPPEALDYAKGGSYALAYFYCGVGDGSRVDRAPVEALTSEFVPRPEILAIARWNPTGEIQIFERKHLHNLSDVLPEHPLAGSIRKCTLRSRNYLIGSVVSQDDYPDAISRGYACHQQHDWDAFLRGGSTRSRIFTHHPGDFGEHNRWTGDLCCRCGQFFMNRSAVLSLYNIPADQPFQYIHAYLPKAEFFDVIETPEVVFASTPMAYAALIFLNPWRWTDDYQFEGREIISDGAVNAAICEVAEAADYPSFIDFQKEILANSWSLDRDHLRLTYVSNRCGALELGADGSRWVDGVPVKRNDRLYDSPLIQSDWDSGIVTITAPGFEKLTLEF